MSEGSNSHFYPLRTLQAAPAYFEAAYFEAARSEQALEQRIIAAGRSGSQQ